VSRLAQLLAFVVSLVAFGGFALYALEADPNIVLSVDVDLKTSGPSKMQVFWSMGRPMREEDSVSLPVHPGVGTYAVSVPVDARALRIDPVESMGAVHISRIVLETHGVPLRSWGGGRGFEGWKPVHDLVRFEERDGVLAMESVGVDPWMEFHGLGDLRADRRTIHRSGSLLVGLMVAALHTGLIRFALRAGWGASAPPRAPAAGGSSSGSERPIARPRFMIRRGKKVLFVVVTLAFTAAGLEALSWGFTLLAGDPPSAIRSRRVAVLASRPGRTDAPAVQLAGRLVDPIVPHPYVGFVYSDYLNEGSHGFFGDDILRYQSANDANVVVIGGSVAGNFFTQVGPEFRKGLAELASLRGRRINLFTLSVGGWHEPQQLLAVTYFLSIGAKMDIVVNIDGFNEAALPVAQMPAYSFLYPRGWPALTSGFADPERRQALGALIAYDGMRRRLAALASPWPIGSSITASVLWSLVDKVAESKTQDLARRLERVELAPFQVGYRPVMDEDRIIAASSDLWARSSKLLHDVLRARKATYVHVLQPNQYVPESKPFSDEERRRAYTPEEPFARWARKGYQALRDRDKDLTTYGVKFLDATHLFAGERETLYVDHCCHFNLRGNRILMQRILGVLRDMKPGS
jgi:hypothetical protein